jgi:hypothetical protein
MVFDDDKLNSIFDRTGGRCHICRRTLAWSNYGRPGARGAWEVDHSVARARGGSDHGNNLFPACVPCNRAKSKRSSRSVRAELGYKRAPLHPGKVSAIRMRRTAAMGVAGAALGAPFGPAAAAIGGVMGAIIGNKSKIDDE